MKVDAGDWVDIDGLVGAMRAQGFNADYENIRTWSSGFLASVSIDGHEIGLIEGSAFGHLVLEWDGKAIERGRLKGKDRP